MENEIVVSICSITYNHAPYIRKCLESFLMQKTNFKFEIIIHDDASTDNTASIIREFEERYPEIIKPIYQTENQYSKGQSVLASFVYPRAKGKYIALCEGDDYWIDPYKLQKQVDFLEQNEDYSFVVGRYIVYDENNSSFDDQVYPLKYKKMLNTKRGINITHKEFYRSWITKTLTSLFRMDCFEKVKSHLFQLTYKRDANFYALLLAVGKGFCMGDILGCYRKHKNGIFNGLSMKEKRTINYYVNKEMYNKYKYDGAFFIMCSCAILNLIKGDFICLKDIVNSYGLKSISSFLKSIRDRYEKTN